MIKLIATDLDGTFLNAWHKATGIHRRAVEATLASGRHFVIATGRHLHTNHQLGLNFLDLPIWKICMNGALIRDSKDNVIYRKAIDDSFVRAVQERFPTVSFEWISEEAVYIKGSKWRHIWKSNYGKLKLKYVLKSLFFLLNGKALPLETCQEPILKIDVYVGDSQLAEELKEFLGEHSEIVQDKGPNKHHFEITANQVDKQTALQFLLQTLQIDEQEVNVYGNDINDLGLLTYFTNAYAPENAIEAVKQIAKDIIPSNEQDGIVHHILKTIAENEVL